MLTLQKATKVVEGKMYISPKLNIVKNKILFCIFCTRKKNCRISVALSRIFLLTEASRFVKYTQHKNFFFSNIEPWRCFLKVLLSGPTKQTFK
jgi:hypothetical protein